MIPFHIEDLYPTPKERIEEPLSTNYSVGDIVKVLVGGPAKSRYGGVVVERNGNYIDSEPDVSEESIGVAVAERMPTSELVEKVVAHFSDSEALVHTVTRWFDSPDQLELVRKSE